MISSALRAQPALPANIGFDDPETEIRAAIERLARAHGFDGAVYMHLGHGLRDAVEDGVPIQPQRLVAMEPFDADQYLKRNYLALDPLPARALRSYGPFAWRLDGFDEAEAGRRRFLGVMAHWGMGGGVVVPVQDYALGPALLNLFDNEARTLDEAVHGALMLAACQVHAQAVASPPARPDSQQGGALTMREMQVLRLAAIGCTEQETAMSLSLSRRGVQFHLVRAVEKLGAVNKTAAVARAVSAGLIRI